jgi:hypothetical protein
MKIGKVNFLSVMTTLVRRSFLKCYIEKRNSKSYEYWKNIAMFDIINQFFLFSILIKMNEIMDCRFMPALTKIVKKYIITTFQPSNGLHIGQTTSCPGI